jgi:hypothetical protein
MCDLTELPRRKALNAAGREDAGMFSRTVEDLNRQVAISGTIKRPFLRRRRIVFHDEDRITTAKSKKD